MADDAPLRATGPVFNVRDREFSATGDGVADDTEAIGKALGELRKAGGGVLFFPPGTYLTEPIEPPSHCALVGYSAWGSTVPGGPGETVLKLHPSRPVDPWGLIRFRGRQEGVRLVGLTLDGEKRENLQGIRVRCAIESAANLMFEGCTIRNFGLNGLAVESVRGLHLRRCTFDGNGVNHTVNGNPSTAHGIYAADVRDLFLTDSVIVRNAGCGILIGFRWSKVTITGTRFEGNGRYGLLVHDGSAQGRGQGEELELSGCRIESHANRPGIGIIFFGQGDPPVGVDPHPYKHIRITGNLFASNKGHHIEFRHPADLLVTGNALRAGKIQGAGNAIPEHALFLQGTLNCVVVGNDMLQGYVHQPFQKEGANKNVIDEPNYCKPLLPG